MNVQPGIGIMQPGFIQIMPNHLKRSFPKLKKTEVRTLSGFCIAIGVASICIQIAALVIYAEKLSYVLFSYDVTGHGIWAGTFYLIAGSLGLSACHKTTMSLLVTTIVFSALSALSAIVSATLAGLSAGQNFSYSCYYSSNYELCDAWWALEWTLMSTAIVSFSFSVPLLVLASVALCGRPKEVNMMTIPGVVYNGQQVFYQQPQQVQMTQQQPFQVFYSPQAQQPAVFQPNSIQLTVKQPEIAQVELKVQKDDKPKLENLEK